MGRLLAVFGGVWVQNRKTRELKFGKTGLLRGGRTVWAFPQYNRREGRAMPGIDTISESRDGRALDDRNRSPPKNKHEI